MNYDSDSDSDASPSQRRSPQTRMDREVRKLEQDDDINAWLEEFNLSLKPHPPFIASPTRRKSPPRSRRRSKSPPRRRSKSPPRRSKSPLRPLSKAVRPLTAEDIQSLPPLPTEPSVLMVPGLTEKEYEHLRVLVIRATYMPQPQGGCVCNFCMKNGHTRMNCPIFLDMSKGKWTTAMSKAMYPFYKNADNTLVECLKCKYCSEYGHFSYHCPKILYGHPFPFIDDTLGLDEYLKCKYCSGSGHNKERCPILLGRKDKPCPYCGLLGHSDNPDKKCNKIKLGPGGQVGECTYKKCKDDKYGHYYVTCSKREADQGPYKFKPGEIPKRALAPAKALEPATRKK